VQLNRTNIYNLKELDDALKVGKEGISFDQLLSSIRFNFKEIEHLCFWDAEEYSKINVGSGVNYELVLICWENKQSSQVHKHEGQDVFSYVIKGELTEEVFDNGELNSPEQTIVLGRRDISSLENMRNKEHRLINSYKGRSVSLHLYIK
jgi:hypothetical protein